MKRTNHGSSHQVKTGGNNKAPKRNYQKITLFLLMAFGTFVLLGPASATSIVRLLSGTTHTGSNAPRLSGSNAVASALKPIVAMQANNALRFDGTNDYVTFGTAAGLSSATFTLETWFRRDGAGVGTSTGTGGLASAIPLISKGRGEAEGSNVDMNYFLGINSTTNVLVADFEEGAAGASPGLNHPI
jgi:hypothetical protein